MDKVEQVLLQNFAEKPAPRRAGTAPGARVTDSNMAAEIMQVRLVLALAELRDRNGTLSNILLLVGAGHGPAHRVGAGEARLAG